MSEKIYACCLTGGLSWPTATQQCLSWHRLICHTQLLMTETFYASGGSEDEMHNTIESRRSTSQAKIDGIQGWGSESGTLTTNQTNLDSGSLSCMCHASLCTLDNGANCTLNLLKSCPILCGNVMSPQLNHEKKERKQKIQQYKWDSGDNTHKKIIPRYYGEINSLWPWPWLWTKLLCSNISHDEHNNAKFAGAY